MQDRLNRYTCDRCGCSVVTVDRKDGTTPMFIGCTNDCGGLMSSAMYRGVEGIPSFEWRSPTDVEYAELDEGSREHVNRGGLLMYPIGL